MEVSKPEVVYKTINGEVCEPYEEVTIEIDEELVRLANESSRRNGLEAQVRFQVGDASSAGAMGLPEFDHAFFNPPFYSATGQVSWGPVAISGTYFWSNAAYDDGRLYSPYQRAEAHSTPFGRLAETGLVGTLPLIALFTALIVYALRAARSGPPDNVVAWALAAGCAGLLVNSVNVDMMNFRFLWFGAGIIRALTAPPARA